MSFLNFVLATEAFLSIGPYGPIWTRVGPCGPGWTLEVRGIVWSTKTHDTIAATLHATKFQRRAQIHIQNRTKKPPDVLPNKTQNNILAQDKSHSPQWGVQNSGAGVNKILAQGCQNNIIFKINVNLHTLGCQKNITQNITYFVTQQITYNITKCDPNKK